MISQPGWRVTCRAFVQGEKNRLVLMLSPEQQVHYELGTLAESPALSSQVTSLYNIRTQSLERFDAAQRGGHRGLSFCLTQ